MMHPLHGWPTRSERAIFIIIDAQPSKKMVNPVPVFHAPLL